MFKINFNHLYYFLNIVDQGTITAAAKKLGMTQPAMSHQLKQLESDFGKKLFIREGRKLILSEAGEQVYDYAKEIFQKSEEMIQTVESGSGHPITFIRVGVASSVPLSHTFKFLKPVMIIQRIRLQVTSGTMDELLDKLINKDIDVVLCDLPYNRRSPNINVKKIRSSKISCYANPKTAARIRKTFPESLNDVKMITYINDSVLRKQVDNFLDKYELTPEIVGEFSSPSLVGHILEHSQYVGFLPIDMSTNLLKAKRLTAIDEIPGSSYGIWSYTLKDSKVKGLIDKFIK